MSRPKWAKGGGAPGSRSAAPEGRPGGRGGGCTGPVAGPGSSADDLSPKNPISVWCSSPQGAPPCPSPSSAAQRHQSERSAGELGGTICKLYTHLPTLVGALVGTLVGARWKPAVLHSRAVDMRKHTLLNWSLTPAASLPSHSQPAGVAATTPLCAGPLSCSHPHTPTVHPHPWAALL